MENTIPISPPTAASEFEARFQQPPAAAADETELARWRQMCKELIEEREGLRAQLSATQTERDRFRRALLAAFAAEEVDFTREEALAAVEQGPSFRELISELQRAER